MNFYILQGREALYEYAKDNDSTFSGIFEDLFNELLQTWNVQKVVTSFTSQIKQTANSTIEFESDQEWMYFHGIRLLTLSPDIYSWFPKRIGSFFVHRLMHELGYESFDTYNKQRRMNQIVSFSQILDNAFTYSGLNMSLINYAHLHTINDFMQLFAFHDIGAGKYSHRQDLLQVL